MKTLDLDKVLDITVDGDNGEQTLKSYLRELLLTLWIEEEGFSGKRPFGNSGWQGDVERALVENGYVEGKITDGYLDEVDEAKAKAIVLMAIKHLFGG